MTLVDSSVWVDYFRAADTPKDTLLDSYLGSVPLALGDLIAAEVLQGVREQRQYRQVKRTLDAFEHVDLVGYALALRAAEHYRWLRDRGVTIRKTIDTLIATYCLEHDRIHIGCMFCAVTCSHCQHKPVMGLLC